MKKQNAIACSQEHVAATLEPHLLRMNAVDAVVNGILVAAALDPSVLLGPVQILVGGPGVGFHAIDGRLRQPGADVPRPRGFVDRKDVPRAARVAVPVLPAAVVGALTAFGTQTINAACQLAIGAASGTPRAEVLQIVARRGATAFVDPTLREALLDAGGRLEGGLLTATDLDGIPATVSPSEATTLSAPDGATRRVFTMPNADVAHADGGVQVVAATDIRGIFAVAAYGTRAEGALVEALGLRAPYAAIPVMRGETRTAPGTVLPAAAPIAIVADDDSCRLALGAAARAAGDAMGPREGIPLATLLAAAAAFNFALPLESLFAKVPGPRWVATTGGREGARGTVIGY